MLSPQARGPKKSELSLNPFIWFLLLLAILFFGCTHHTATKPAKFKKPLKPKEDLPLKVAILPFENQTDDKTIADEFRRIFAGHFSKKTFIDKEIAIVDASLKRGGISSFEEIKGRYPEELGKILNVDGLIYGRVLKYKSYARAMVTKVEAEVELIDAHNGKMIARAGPFSQSSYDLDLPISPFGAAWMLVKGVIRDPQARRFSVLNALSARLVEALPEPPREKLIRQPRIYALVHDFSYVQEEEKVPKKAGEVINIVIVGDKGCEAFFAIEGITGRIPMKEEPYDSNYSHYNGQYRVKPGDNCQNAPIVAFLISQQGVESRFKDNFSLSIDTTPPKPPEDLKGMGRDRLALLNWKANEEEDLKGYMIYRKKQSEAKYRLIEKVSTPEFEDKGIENFCTYLYRITAFDIAGNESAPSETIEVIPKPAPPTAVSTDIIKDTTWYEAASPYIIEGNIRILKQATLTIEPGVIVKSKGGNLRVMGRLIAKGTRGDLIVFTSAKKEQSPSRGDWQGIFFDHASNPASVIEYCRIQYAKTAITAISSSPIIKNNVITRNIGGILCEDFSQPVIEYNEIYNNKTFGIKAVQDSDPVIRFNRIEYNAEYGIWCDQPLSHFSLNTISHNGKYDLYYLNEKGLVFDVGNNFWGKVDHKDLKSRIFGTVKVSLPRWKGKKGEKKKEQERQNKKEKEIDPWKKLRESLGN